uniref:DUF305 domain-containing protein n=1 Tax=viral metagenome TaxID=1070528 RepID=A0A6C0F042_9ZZZZ
MNLQHGVIFMVIGSFIVQYVIMSAIMANSYVNITNSMGKFYLSSIMAFMMGILEVFMHDFSHHTTHTSYYVPLFIGLAVALILYRFQIGVTDKQYLHEMIEHHSMAILTSDEILKKTSNYHVRRLASQIAETQQSEIKQMKEMIASTDERVISY